MGKDKNALLVQGGITQEQNAFFKNYIISNKNKRHTGHC